MTPQWSTQCLDWETRLIEGRSLITFPPLFPDEAEAALAIYRDLRMVDANGSPRNSEICRQWVFDFVAAIFGAYDREAGRRLINQFFLLISKKNGKSTTAAGIMLTALLRNWRQSAEFIILAPTIEIANNSASPAMDMVKHDPELRKLLRPIPNRRMIEHMVTGATLKIVAADSEVVAGKKASGVLIDELWLFGKVANAENMLREATGGLASRPEGFVIALSTQSDEPPSGVFKQWLKRYRRIRDGKLIAPRSLGVLYEFSERMLEAKAYEDPQNWYITNPNLGASVDEEFIHDRFEEAKETDKGSLAGFYSKYLNVQIGSSLLDDRWRGADYWQDAALPGLTLDGLLDRSECVTIGIDGGGLDDMFGVAVLGREKKTGKWLLWNRAWVQPLVLETRKEIAEQLRDFANDGDLVICEGKTQHLVEVADLIKRLDDTRLLPEKEGIGVDPYAIVPLIEEITARGIDEERITGVQQGTKHSPASWGMEQKLYDGTLWHCGQPLMTWCVSNARTEQRGNAVLITKQTAGKAKIDPLIATFNAVFLMSRNPVAAVRVDLDFWLGQPAMAV